MIGGEDVGGALGGRPGGFGSTPRLASHEIACQGSGDRPHAPVSSFQVAQSLLRLSTVGWIHIRCQRTSWLDTNATERRRSRSATAHPGRETRSPSTSCQPQLELSESSETERGRGQHRCLGDGDNHLVVYCRGVKRDQCAPKTDFRGNRCGRTSFARKVDRESRAGSP